MLNIYAIKCVAPFPLKPWNCIIHLRQCFNFLSFSACSAPTHTSELSTRLLMQSQHSSPSFSENWALLVCTCSACMCMVEIHKTFSPKVLADWDDMMYEEFRSKRYLMSSCIKKCFCLLSVMLDDIFRSTVTKVAKPHYKNTTVQVKVLHLWVWYCYIGLL